jgi:hypothetical protein
MKKYLDTKIKDVNEINKTFKPIWKFTYKYQVEKGTHWTCEGRSR